MNEETYETMVRRVNEHLRYVNAQLLANTVSATDALQSVLADLICLTDFHQGAASNDAPQAQPASIMSAVAGSLGSEAAPEESCKQTGHHKNLNVFGVCKDCGTCTHSVGTNPDGTCRTCGKEVAAAPAA